MVIPKIKKVFCVGVDPGKSADNTAIAVVEKIAPSDWNAAAGPPRDKPEYHVRRLNRLPPGTSYTDVANTISAVLSYRMLNETKKITTHKIVREIDLSVDLVIDQTAVGKKITDMIVGIVGKAAVRAILSTTQGEHYSDGLEFVPILSLIGGLEVLLETKTLKIPEDGKYSRELLNQLIYYRNRKTPTVAPTTNMWRDQPSDDLVFAVALACWRLERPGFSYEFLDLS